MGGSRPAAQPQGERAERGGGGERARQCVACPSLLFFFSTSFFFFFPLVLPRAATLLSMYAALWESSSPSATTLLRTGCAPADEGGAERIWTGTAPTPSAASEAAQSALGRAAVGAGSNRISVERESQARQTLNLAGVTQGLVGAGRLCLQVRHEPPPQPHTSSLTPSSWAPTARTCVPRGFRAPPLSVHKVAPLLGRHGKAVRAGNAERPRFSQ